jgi:two-component system, NtrC family, sensor kinase
VAHARHAAGHLPFTLFYAIPFLLDLNPRPAAHQSGRPLAGFLPLTFSWAIVRYRLMDTDLIFKRGVAYTLATGLMLGRLLRRHRAHRGDGAQRLPEAVREWGLGIAILVTAAIFDPLKRRIQGWVDRAFDRHRYDYRKALVEFGRGLSSETDLQALLELHRRAAAAHAAGGARRRLPGSEDSGAPAPGRSHGLPPRNSHKTPRTGSPRSGLPRLRPGQGPLAHLLENAQQALHLPRTSSAPPRCST